MEKKNPVEEARRYVDNAKQTLKDNGEYDSSLKRYGDRKYVRAAGHYLWNAVLIVVDAIFHVKTKTRPHPDIKDEVAYPPLPRIVRFQCEFTSDGTPLEFDVTDTGFSLADQIITRCAAMLK